MIVEIVQNGDYTVVIIMINVGNRRVARYTRYCVSSCLSHSKWALSVVTIDLIRLTHNFLNLPCALIVLYIREAKDIG